MADANRPLASSAVDGATRPTQNEKCGRRSYPAYPSFGCCSALGKRFLDDFPVVDGGAFIAAVVKERELLVIKADKP